MQGTWFIIWHTAGAQLHIYVICTLGGDLIRAGFCHKAPGLTLGTERRKSGGMWLPGKRELQRMLCLTVPLPSERDGETGPRKVGDLPSVM